MSQINKIHELEKAVILLLNFDGWDLEHTGGGFEHYDAVGATPKGVECVIEFKFRNKYYSDKLLEKYKYDELMNMPYDVAKLYWINDPKGNYMFYLNKLEVPEPVDMWCPDTTLWNNKKILKECYLIPETDASIINYTKDF